MKILSALLAVMILTAAPAWSGAAGIARTYSVEEYFLANDLAMEKYFNEEIILREQDDPDLSGGIYEYGTKSPAKAFFLSLVVPGAGEYYNGQKTRAGAFLAVDALLWTGYFIYHKKGSNKENDYEAFAQDNYTWESFIIAWDQLPEEDKTKYSHRMPWDAANNQPDFNHEYYENIGKYDQFQVGWNDIDYSPWDIRDSTEAGGIVSPLRSEYLDMRKKANDYFSNATTVAMISIANHVISAFDAAIGAKRFNKGGRQYSLNLKTKNIDGKTTPFLTLTAKF
jgi:hypothetical protein